MIGNWMPDNPVNSRLQAAEYAVPVRVKRAERDRNADHPACCVKAGVVP